MAARNKQLNLHGEWLNPDLEVKGEEAEKKTKGEKMRQLHLKSLRVIIIKQDREISD